MTALPDAQSLYLPCEPDPAFMTVHWPENGRARDTAVLLCPPFGWDEVSSYRSVRFWAGRLAQDGYPALRLSLPGTGDSGGGPRDPDRLGAWVAAVGSAAAWLRAHTGATRLVAVGIGMGGMLAYLAAADGAAIDDLVLWATPTRGRTLVRQISAFSRLEESRLSDGARSGPELPPGELEAGGFVLTPETVAQLKSVDLSTVELPMPTDRRALLLEHDGLAVEPALREHLERSGSAVTVGSGNGFGEMTSHPELSRPPLEVIAAVRAWLDEVSSAEVGIFQEPATEAATSAELRLDGVTARETAVTVPASHGELSGVLVEPLDQPRHGVCVVLLNAGAVRRIGPSRMWVEAARRWAAQGVPSLRLDVEGVGESDGDEPTYGAAPTLSAPKFVPQVLSALDFLQRRGVGERFVLGGWCSGAHWSFHAAVQDPRVGGVLLVNPRVLIRIPGLAAARDMRRLLSEPFSLSKILRLARGSRLKVFVEFVLTAPARWLRNLARRETPAAAAERELDAAFSALAAAGKRVLLLFSEHEAVYEELARTGHVARLATEPSVTIELIGVRDHTMRPLWAQREAHAALDRAMAREPGIGFDSRQALEPAQPL